MRKVKKAREDSVLADKAQLRAAMHRLLAIAPALEAAGASPISEDEIQAEIDAAHGDHGNAVPIIERTSCLVGKSQSELDSFDERRCIIGRENACLESVST
jgi:hypothetical protein